ncbi:hypothetical protein [Yinghuangia sp. YIM S09857]|uniref:phage terminase small subunit n=1 Tax=Yinghuangia sp. YIM S09857 TaxID=3436929 RepID=UPI003F5321F4
MLAPLVEAYWTDPKPSILAEIRLNEERLGATVRDRQALRMTVGGTAASHETARPNEGVADMDRYRQAFGG